MYVHMSTSAEAYLRVLDYCVLMSTYYVEEYSRRKPNSKQILVFLIKIKNLRKIFRMLLKTS